MIISIVVMLNEYLAQCSMFSDKGKQQFEELNGKTIRLIIGVNEIQD